MDLIGEFSLIDVLIGLTCYKQEHSELFFRSKYILDRRIKSVDKYFYRNIPSFIDLTEKRIIKRDPRLLVDESDHRISLIMPTLFEILLHFLITPKCSIEDKIQIMMKTIFEDFIGDTHRIFLEITGIFSIVPIEERAIGIDIDDDKIPTQIDEDRLKEFTLPSSWRSCEEYARYILRIFHRVLFEIPESRDNRLSEKCRSCFGVGVFLFSNDHICKMKTL